MNERRRTVRRQAAVPRIAALFLFVGGITAGRALADVIRVPEDYGTIQAAVDAAASGDVVRVGPGTYGERVRISRSGIRLEADRALTAILDGSGFTTVGAAIAVVGTATNHVTGVSVVGFRVENQFGPGIDLNFADHCEIRSNTVNNTTAQSIAVARSTFNVIVGNTLSNGTFGVGLSMVSSDNTVKENTIAGAFTHGIRVSMVNTTPLRNLIKENLICVQGASGLTGILVAQFASGNTFKENKVVGNGASTVGIRLEGPTLGNTVKENILNDHAIDIEDLGTDNSVSENDRHRNLRCPRF